MSDKQSTLQLLDQEYQTLRQAIERLNGEQMEQVWYDAWSVKDIIAHILCWEREMTGALQRMARGERPTPEGVDYSNADPWNAKFAAAYRPISPNTVLADWQQTHANFVKAAQAIPDDRFGEGKTANRILEGSGYGHYREHGGPIREWRQQAGV